MSKLTRFIVLTAGLLGPVVMIESMRATFLEQLPFSHPDELVLIKGAAQPGTLDFSDWFGASPAISGLTILTYGRATWSATGATRRIDVLTADHMTLPLLGLSTPLGRSFQRPDLRTGDTALISPALWRSEFSVGSPLGRRLLVNGRAHEVIGVAPEELLRLGRFDVVLPRSEGRFSGVPLGSGETFLTQVTLGRRPAGVSVADVQRDIERLQRLREKTDSHSTVSVMGLKEALTAPAGPVLTTLVLASGVLLMLAAVTIGMLAAMHAAERSHEFAIRGAVGATERQIRLQAAQPWLTSMIPAASLALILALPLTRFTRTALPSLGEPTLASGAVLIGVLAVAFALSLVASLGTQLPILSGGRDLGIRLRDFRLTRLRLASILVAAQLSLSVGLFCGAAVAVKAFDDQFGRDIGLSTKGLQVFHVDLGEGRPREELSLAWARLAQEARAYGGSFATGLPWSPTAARSWVSNPLNRQGAFVGVTRVGPRFFELLGVPFADGSDPFSDRGTTTDVVVCQDSARQMSLRVGSVVELDEATLRVAGIVKPVDDIRQAPGVRTPRVFLSLGFGNPPASMTVLLRGSVADARLAKARTETALPWASISAPQPVLTEFAAVVRRQQLGARVLAGYALLAALMAGLGLHALLRRHVALRRAEVGLRLALGATRRQIDRDLLQPLMAPALIGIGAGALVGLQISKAVGALMPWARPLDPAIYAMSLLGGLGIAVLAVWPSLRFASRVEPAELLHVT